MTFECSDQSVSFGITRSVFTEPYPPKYPRYAVCIFTTEFIYTSILEMHLFDGTHEGHCVLSKGTEEKSSALSGI